MTVEIIVMRKVNEDWSQIFKEPFDEDEALISFFTIHRFLYYTNLIPKNEYRILSSHVV